MTYDRRLTPLAESLCCPHCGGPVDLEPLAARPTTPHDATCRVSCAAGEYRRVVSGRDISDLEGVALRASQKAS